MIQIFFVLALFLQHGLTEPPVNEYLPSSKSSHFAKTYSPPAANVSFNFGFSPRTSKSNIPFGYSSQRSTLMNNYEPSYRNKHFQENIDTSNHPQLLKTIGSVDNKPEDRSYTMSPYSSYGTPSYSTPPPYTTNLPYNGYGVPAQDTLPIIEENLVQRKAQQGYQTSAKNPEAAVGRSHPGYPPSRSSDGHSESHKNHENYPYDFSYEVMSAESGVSLGHHENHDGSSAEGVYHNLLPDGRLLTVEYWADDDGFKPRLSYKNVHSSNSGSTGPY